MGATVKPMLFLIWLAAASPAAAMIDPTAPPKPPAASRVDAKTPGELAWVRVNGKQSLAWYGGRTVRLGDVVEGGRVVAILEDHIVIAGREGRRAVHLLNPAVRTRQSNNQR